MKKYRVVDQKQFRHSMSSVVRVILISLLIILFVALITKYDGLEEREIITEYRTYEVEYVQSPVNNRLKEPVLKEVVYRYVQYK